jgi:alcohol dehydrogenase (cytochrome c)
MPSMKRIPSLAAAVAVATLMLTSRAADPAGAQSLAAPVFTTAQQSAGESTYKESCASCHGKNLDDGEFGPPLKGPEFRSAWFGRTADVLLTKLETMPPAAPGSLGAGKHVDLLAYLMSQNQLVASDKPLPADIDQLKTMLLPGATGGPSGGLSPNAVLPSAPHVVNPLDTYTPITDAMLQNPPAGEWPSWRRGSDGQGFSPLKQINKSNVAELRAAWSWALPNGPNESTPIFHDGVLFVHSYGDKVQAIDAATGDLLWQYSRRLPTSTPVTVKRAIAIYGDKVYAGTSDTHLVALDV